jgi:hypothetical protein
VQRRRSSLPHFTLHTSICRPRICSPLLPSAIVCHCSPWVVGARSNGWFWPSSGVFRPRLVSPPLGLWFSMDLMNASSFFGVLLAVGFGVHERGIFWCFMASHSDFDNASARFFWPLGFHFFRCCSFSIEAISLLCIFLLFPFVFSSFW